MIPEETIKTLFRDSGLGTVVCPVTSVSGGFLHRMYRVNTSAGSYAVKYLNPEVMARPDAMENYRRAEALEAVLEDAGIPIVPAVLIGGRKMQEIDGAFFYIFHWHDGETTDWNHISPEQCRLAGSLQGRIHAIAPERIAAPEPEISDIDWAAYAGEAEQRNNEIAALLRENVGLLERVQEKLNEARRALPPIRCVTDEDMDPKNVLWENGKPLVIDLECLDYGNPVSHAMQLSLQWSGVTTCHLRYDRQKAFFDGYLAAYDNGFRDYAAVFGVAYTWIEWLAYNISRALGQNQDEAEYRMGVSEVGNTIARIRYLADHESRIRDHLKSLFS